MKVAFIQRGTKHEVQHDEFWAVEILEEKGKGQFKGCFLLKPLYKIEKDDILRLPPNTFSVRKHNGLLILNPIKSADSFWIIPLLQRKALAVEHNAYGVVVELEERGDWHGVRDIRG